MKNKRTNFSWIKNTTARKAKAFIAAMADEHRANREITKRKAFFRNTIYPRVLKRFPNLHDIVAKHYNSKERALSSDRFFEITYARFACMYDTDFKPTSEHPSRSKNKEMYVDYIEYRSKIKTSHSHT
jgi:hypothetical protein